MTIFATGSEWNSMAARTLLGGLDPTRVISEPVLRAVRGEQAQLPRRDLGRAPVKMAIEACTNAGAKDASSATAFSSDDRLRRQRYHRQLYPHFGITAELRQRRPRRACTNGDVRQPA